MIKNILILSFFLAVFSSFFFACEKIDSKNNFYTDDYREGSWVNKENNDTLLFQNIEKFRRRTPNMPVQKFIYDIDDDVLILTSEDDESVSFHEILEYGDSMVVLGNMFEPLNEEDDDSRLYYKVGD